MTAKARGDQSYYRLIHSEFQQSHMRVLKT